MTQILDFIRQIAPGGLQFNLWPREGGGYQANVKVAGSNGWTVFMADDPLDALDGALRARLCRVPDRKVVADAQQIDIEDLLADDFDELLADDFEAPL